MFFLLATRPRELHLISIVERGEFEFYSPNILKLVGPTVSTLLTFFIFVFLLVVHYKKFSNKIDKKIAMFTLFFFYTVLVTLICSTFINESPVFSLMLTDLKFLIFMFAGILLSYQIKLSRERFAHDLIFLSLVLGFASLFNLLYDLHNGVLLLMYNHSTFISCIGLGIALCCVTFKHKITKFFYIIILLLGAIPLTRGEQLIFALVLISSLIYLIFILRNTSAIITSMIIVVMCAGAFTVLLYSDNALSDFVLRKFEFFVSGNLSHDKSSSVRLMELFSILEYSNTTDFFRILFGSGFGSTFSLPFIVLLSLDPTDFSPLEISNNAFLMPHFFLTYWIFKYGIVGAFIFLVFHLYVLIRFKGFLIIPILVLPTILWQSYWSPGYAILGGLLFGVSFLLEDSKLNK